MPDLVQFLFKQPLISQYVTNSYLSTKKKGIPTQAEIEKYISDIYDDRINRPKKGRTRQTGGIVTANKFPREMIPEGPRKPFENLKKDIIEPQIFFHYVNVFLLSSYDEASFNIFSNVTRETRINNHTWDSSRDYILDINIWNNPLLVTLMSKNVAKTAGTMAKFLRDATSKSGTGKNQ